MRGCAVDASSVANFAEAVDFLCRGVDSSRQFNGVRAPRRINNSSTLKHPFHMGYLEFYA